MSVQLGENSFTDGRQKRKKGLFFAHKNLFITMNSWYFYSFNYIFIYSRDKMYFNSDDALDYKILHRPLKFQFVFSLLRIMKEFRNCQKMLEIFELSLTKVVVIKFYIKIQYFIETSLISEYHFKIIFPDA